MIRRSTTIAALMLVALSAAGMPADGSGQEVQGVALDPYGQPIDGAVVALHRIGDMGAGANVASATTDADGRFRFEVERPDSALYFAAMRYDGRMYIGPPAMAGAERVTGYVLRAEPDAEAGAVATALSGTGAGAMQGAPFGGGGPTAGRGATGQGADAALLAVGVLALAAAGLFMATAPRYRRRRTRDALYELATVEEELAGELDDGDRQQLLRRRHDLRGRLAPPA